MEISETGGTMKTFEVKEDFYLDGKKVKIIPEVCIIFVLCRNTGATDWKN